MPRKILDTPESPRSGYAGKRPTRVPIWTSQPKAPPVLGPMKPSRSKKSDSPKTSAHRMITRSRLHQFRILDLPPEVRNQIYYYAFCSTEDELVDMSNFKLPPVLSVSRALRTEGLPVYFATKRFTTTVRSNWCVRNAHFHSPVYIRYEEAGVVDLAPLLVSADLRLPAGAVRFQQVDFCITCVCCVLPREIGSMTLRIVGRKPVVEGSMSNEKLKLATRTSFLLMLGEARMLAERIAERELFSGFMAKDIVDMAACFRYEGGE